jgi:glycine cleavage system H protein
VSELFAPVSGEIVEVNTELADSPEKVNAGTYEQGWMVVIKATDRAELEELMDAAAYDEFLGTLG